MALLEELLLFIDEEDAVAAFEKLVVDCFNLSHLTGIQLFQSTQLRDEIPVLLVNLFVEQALARRHLHVDLNLIQLAKQVF